MKDILYEELPLVSVIMAVYNETKDELLMALKSIEDQSYCNIEIIIVYDNPSNLDLLYYLENYVKDNSKIKLIKNDFNIGLANSLNIGINNSRGTYIARMDADDISVPRRISNQIKFMLENKNIDILSSECTFINERNEVIGSTSIRDYSSAQMKKLIVFQNFFIHPSWLVKRDVYDALDGYREFSSAQDYDFLLRAISKGFDIGIIHEKLIMYRIRGNSISSKSKLKQFLTAEYIKKLHYERTKTGYDSFNLLKLDNLLSEVSINEERIFNEAQDKYNDNKFYSIIYLYKTKYFRKYISQKICFTICRILYRRELD
ncbi:glycosyltransferase [Enterococcus innesii]|uniref:glycosyltransferase n=1 Tax=Enterococcus innesii TaxID=2839759 RepID=UPI002091454D|nr:glycosyltransferase [Enterococcus innesii]MCO5495574.1 glycosyltransferase [Enterococcus innesii]